MFIYILEKLPNVKFHENRREVLESLHTLDGRTDRYKEANTRQFLILICKRHRHVSAVNGL
jgi:hypothetical protein